MAEGESSVCPEPFNPSGSLSFTDYVRQWENYFGEQQVSDEEQQRDEFVDKQDDGVFSVILKVCAPNSPDEISFVDLVKRLALCYVGETFESHKHCQGERKKRWGEKVESLGESQKSQGEHKSPHEKSMVSGVGPVRAPEDVQKSPGEKSKSQGEEGQREEVQSQGEERLCEGEAVLNMQILVPVAGKVLTMEVDSGARYSLIGWSTFKECFSPRRRVCRVAVLS